MSIRSFILWSRSSSNLESLSFKASTFSLRSFIPSRMPSIYYGTNLSGLEKASSIIFLASSLFYFISFSLFSMSRSWFSIAAASFSSYFILPISYGSSRPSLFLASFIKSLYFFNFLMASFCMSSKSARDLLRSSSY